MEKFIYFLAGIIFISYIQPLLDEILSVLLTFLEILKGIATKKITKLKVDIQNLTSTDKQDVEEEKNIYGFKLD